MTSQQIPAELQAAASDDGIQSIASDTDVDTDDFDFDMPRAHLDSLMGAPTNPATDPWEYCRLLHDGKDFGVELAWQPRCRQAPANADDSPANTSIRMHATAFKCNMCQSWAPYPTHYGVGARQAAEMRIRHFTQPTSDETPDTDDHTITCSLCERRQPLRLSNHFLERVLASHIGGYFEETHSVSLFDKDHRLLASGRAALWKYADHPSLTSPVQTVAAAYNRLASTLQRPQRERSRSRQAAASRTVAQPAEEHTGPAKLPRRVRQLDLGRYFSPRKTAPAGSFSPRRDNAGA